MLGLTLRMSSTSMRSLARTAGNLLVKNTSAVAAIRYRMSIPSGELRSSPMLRLPRLECCSSGCQLPPSRCDRPDDMIPRIASPRSTGSILMTSAPQSESTADAAGTNVCSATSRTRTPCITAVTTATSYTRWSSLPGTAKPDPARLSPFLQDHFGRAPSHRHHRSVEVARHHRRQDRHVDYPQSVDTPHSKPRIDGVRRIGPHRTSSRSVIARSPIEQASPQYCVVVLDCQPRHSLG